YLHVADQLSAMIRSGELKIGQRLPSERDLAARFSVSRPTVREAIVTLEVMKRGGVRPRSGVYVREAVGSRIEVPEDLPGPFEILEAPKVLESEIAAIAAARISNDDLRRMKTQLKKLDSPTRSVTEIERHDQEFHT